MAAGYYLGSPPFFKKHFELVLIAVVVISLLPMAWEIWRHRRAHKNREAAEAVV